MKAKVFHVFLLCTLCISIIVSAGTMHGADFPEDKIVLPESYVIAYYFHGNFRCASCKKIETYAKEAIDDNFKPELESGKIVFEVINVEQKGNEHFVKSYNLYTRSVVLSLVKDGKEIKHENLNKVWECLGNKEKFVTYVKGEVSRYLKEV